MSIGSLRAPSPRPLPRPLVVAGAVAATIAFAAVGLLGVYRYVDNYWLYRGYPPPKDPGFVKEKGTTTRFYVASPALGGRHQPVDVYLPPGYQSHPGVRYPVLYLLHGFPGRPGAFLQTVRLGVVEDVLAAKGKLSRPPILIMPFGSTGSFTDKEWVNGVHPNEAWATFVTRDLVRAVDARYRTIRSGSARAIAGLSEGGYGAINIGLHHPGEFRVIESWSGYQTADPVPSIFGDNRSLLTANTPLDQVAQAAPALRRDHVYLWFYSGTGDPMHVQNQRFAADLSRLGIPHKFFLVKGGHDWSLWRDNAVRALLAAVHRLGSPRA